MKLFRESPVKQNENKYLERENMKKTVSIMLLIVALLLVGAGIATVLWFSYARQFSGSLPFGNDQVSATADESKAYASQGVTQLQVQDDAGDVSIVSGEGDQIVVKASKTAWGTNQNDAEKALEKVKYQVTKRGDSLIVKYEVEQSNFGAQNRPDTVDFVITVPEEMKVDVNAGFGALELTGTKGDASLTSDFGEISVENLEGALDIATESGTVTAKSVNAGANDVILKSGFGRLKLEEVIAGKLLVESNSGVIELIDVSTSGEMELSTKFGDVLFEKGSAGELTIATDSGKVELASLEVSGLLNVKDQFGNIALEQVSANSYAMETNSGAIDAEGVSGPVRAHSGFGSISIKGGENTTLDLSTNSGVVSYEGTLGEGPHLLHSDFGEIRIALPSDTALRVDLKTEFGKIQSALPVTVTINENVDAQHLVGTVNGGGEQITASTKSGDILIEALAQ